MLGGGGTDVTEQLQGYLVHGSMAFFRHRVEGLAAHPRFLSTHGEPETAAA
jgi:hypothetical protein